MKNLIRPQSRSYLFTHSQTKKMVNGKITQDTTLRTEYDGKVLKMDKCNKNECLHYRVKNKDLIKKRKATHKKTKQNKNKTKKPLRNQRKTKKRY